jgi:hypothetical protein
MLNKNQYEKYFYFGILFGVLILLLNLYYYAHPLWKEAGLSWHMLDNLCISLSRSPLFSHSLKTKIAALVLISLGMLSRSSKAREVDLKIIALVGVISAACYFIPFPRHGIYVIFTIIGAVGMVWVVSMIARRETKAIINDDNETFPQCQEKIENENSINLPMVYQYQQKMHKGWINVVNPFRGILVLGSPGSGKSYSVYEPFIDQMMAKGYAMCVYDYKYPTLSKNVYNKLLQYQHRFPVKPEFCVLNFDDPMHSLRANPTHPSYIESQADCAEIAELIMLNINKVAREKNDFFTESSKALLDGTFWYLRTHEDGKYCTFPHAIEFLNQDYRKVIAMLVSDPDVKTKISSFADAFEAGANDQLQGMIASTRIPLGKFTSRNLYWVMTGDDFNLAINDPEHPKVLCIGNNPDRELIYGTCIALYTSRMFKQINHQGRNKCAVLLDEMPTVYLPGLDKILNTCRSNGVVFVVGGQDVSQFYRDYGKKEADVLINTPGTTFIGQVNGESAKTMSQVFGKLDRVRESESIGRSNDSVSISMQEKEIMPARKIETLSTGTFFGRVADTHSDKIERKLFCAEIQRDNEAVAAEKKKWVDIPVMTDFGADYIRRKIIADPEPYIKDQIKYELQTSGVLYHPDEIDDEVERKYKSLDRAEFMRLQDEIIDFKLNLLMEEIVEANYQRIKQEAADLVRRAWDDEEESADTTESASPEDARTEPESPGPKPVFIDPFHEID